MTPLRIAIINGSTRTGRFGPMIVDWVAGAARQRADMVVDTVDAASRSGEVLAAADAFVVVTPEYNHSFPGDLKKLIDAHFTEWQAKPVAFVSHGGVSGGLRAVEHLRGVFAELHAVGIRDSVSFHRPWNWFGSDGRPESAQAEIALKKMFDQLTWWALALRDARAVRPFEA
ncbi:NADPH-dependent FMN reductase [Spirillospora albida]|uniref:NADPH-dependent FMN reductase n=1 Tax=Spirillospora albida TaxID=58123 RepID=UPI0004BE7838|nr:NAD(P)H-dependent oxidoreductase [Spirillospora albida]